MSGASRECRSDAERPASSFGIATRRDFAELMTAERGARPVTLDTDHDRRPSCDDSSRPRPAAVRGPGGEVVAVRAAGVDVAQELLPLGAEPVRVLLDVGHLFPLRPEVLVGGQVGVPDRLGRLGPRLDAAAEQTGGRRAVGAVDLELDQLAAVDPDRPGRVDLGDDPAVELEDPVRRVVGGRGVGVALLVPALRDVGDGLGHHGLDRAEQVLQHVVPVAEHVEHHAAAVLGAVVPARALGGDDVTLEHPVAELAADREDAAEEAEVDQPLQLDQAGEVELVVHDAGDGAGLLRGGHQLLAVQHGLGDRLLGEDVLAGLDARPGWRRCARR